MDEACRCFYNLNPCMDFHPIFQDIFNIKGSRPGHVETTNLELQWFNMAIQSFSTVIPIISDDFKTSFKDFQKKNKIREKLLPHCSISKMKAFLIRKI